jgi:ATP:ADP antiporter, AAA family
MAGQQPRSALDGFLNIFTDVREGESRTALLLALNVFLILTAYYILKTVREALILGEGSAELKSYMSAAQVAVLALAVPAYGRLVVAVPRMTLINRVTLIFAACPIVFFVLTQAGMHLGMVFFVWIGIFNLMIVAQFWSFANDVYSKDEGERLFPIIGFGASLGAVAGSIVADRLIERVGVSTLMLVGAATIGLQLFVTNVVDRRERGRRKPAPASRAASTKEAKPSGNAFALVFRTRYLLLIALMLLALNWVNTTGEYILGSIVKESAARAIAAGQALPGLTEGQVIGRFYARYFTFVNALGLLMQLFIVSRIVKYFGVRWAVLIHPLLSFSAYNVIVFVPTLAAVMAAKVAENATDYSLNNTVRNMLFLPCTYEEKFSAKQAIDSFFVRMGDVLSALLVFIGTTFLALPARGFALVNMALVIAWFAIAWQVGRLYQVRTAAAAAPKPAVA